ELRESSPPNIDNDRCLCTCLVPLKSGPCSPLFEIALVLVRLDHGASRIVKRRALTNGSLSSARDGLSAGSGLLIGLWCFVHAVCVGFRLTIAASSFIGGFCLIGCFSLLILIIY